MPTSTDRTTGTGNTVPSQGDHDRVVMLSLKADGTPDQHNPEIVGDKDTALAATKEQFAQQAVSAADSVRNAEVAAAAAGSTADAQIDKVKAEHDKLVSAAEKRAESVVGSLHQG